MDLIEPHWRTNSSFSPPVPLDRGVHSDHLLHGSQGVSVNDSLSTSSRRSRVIGSDDNNNNNDNNHYHHHSVSDGVLSYSGDSPGNYLAGRWTLPVQKCGMGEFAHSSIGGSILETSWLPHSAEMRHASRRFATASYNYGSPSSTDTPLNFPNRNNRHSFMSKPVYPLMFHNPISSSTDHSFQETLTELQETGVSSPEKIGGGGSSSDGEYLEDSDTILDLEILRSPACHIGGDDDRCEVCRRFLWQKSPWSSRRIVRSGDLPVAGVLPCCHVFHADCLEHVKGGTHEPPCPVCMNIVEFVKESASISEPLEIALRSVRRRENMAADWDDNREVRIVKTRIGKRLSFNGKLGKDLFSKKLFKRAFCSSKGGV